MACFGSTTAPPNPDGARADLVAHSVGQALWQLSVAASLADPSGWLGGELLNTPTFGSDQIPSSWTRALPFEQFDYEYFSKDSHSRIVRLLSLLGSLTYTSSQLGTLSGRRQLASFLFS